MDLINRVLLLTDNTRLAEDANLHPEWYKEWYHFCFLGPEIEVIVNFSLFRDSRILAPDPFLTRVTLLVHASAWDGDVEEIPAQDIQLNPGRIELRFGQNWLSFQKGVFRISVALERRPITLDLILTPVSFPLLRSRASIGPGVIDWLVVPRLEASGTVVVDRHVHRLEGVPAYHDHNWGHWLWGHDFSWNWGFALPTNTPAAWSLVFDSVSNRSRSQVQELKLCLWKGEKLARIFAQRDILVRPQGYLARKRVPKFPRVMGLIAPELTTDVPRILEIEAKSGGDQLACHFEADDIAQIVIPNETDLGETIINEVSGKIRAEGRVNGEAVQIEGKGLFEFLA